MQNEKCGGAPFKCLNVSDRQRRRTATRLKQTIVSNIRPQGLARQAAAARIVWLLNQMRIQQGSGVALKDWMNQQVQAPAG